MPNDPRETYVNGLQSPSTVLRDSLTRLRMDLHLAILNAHAALRGTALLRVLSQEELLFLAYTEKFLNH